MKKLLAGALGIFALAMISCGETVDEFVPPYVPPTDGGELPALNAPKSLSLAANEGRWVVLAWTGDDTATAYEVEVTPQGGEARTLQTESTSMGFYDLADVTNYTWRVRAKRGNDSSEWVVGTGFTTKPFTDPRTDYIGLWRLDGQAWDVAASLSTSGILSQTMDLDLSQIEELLPIDIINELVGIATFSLEMGAVEDPTYSQLIIGLSPLNELVELPYTSTAIQLNTNNGKLMMSQNLNQAIPYPGQLPVAIADIPFLADIMGGGGSPIPGLDVGNITMQITKFEVTLTKFSLELGPLNKDTDPYSMGFKGVLHADLTIETDESMANAVIAMSRPMVSISFTSNVNKQ